jgi:hypothetical protein
MQAQPSHKRLATCVGYWFGRVIGPNMGPLLLTTGKREKDYRKSAILICDDKKPVFGVFWTGQKNFKKIVD